MTRHTTSKTCKGNRKFPESEKKENLQIDDLFWKLFFLYCKVQPLYTNAWLNDEYSVRRGAFYCVPLRRSLNGWSIIFQFTFYIYRSSSRFLILSNNKTFSIRAKCWLWRDENEKWLPNRNVENLESFSPRRVFHEMKLNDPLRGF